MSELSEANGVAESTSESRFRQAMTKHRAGDSSGAESDYRAIISATPDYARAWHFLAVLLHEQARDTEAGSCFERAIAICPTNAVYFNNFGVFLKDTGQTESALKAFLKAVELNPDYADAHSNLGCIALMRNELPKAEHHLGRALTLSPGHTDAAVHLRSLRFRQGHYFYAQNDFHRSNAAFCEAASLPGGRELWRWKSLGFCPTVFADFDSADHYWRQLNKGLDLALQSRIPMDWRNLPTDGFTPSFNLPHLDRCCREVKEKFSKLFEKAFPPNRCHDPARRKQAGRVRVGFVVTTGHHRGFLRVYRQVLESLDPKRFDVLFICPAGIVESCRQSIRSEHLTWIGLPSRFDRAVEALRETRCDILYHWKVGGGTLDYFLALSKSAPIQCTSYGTHGTSGAFSMDYYLSSVILETQNSSEHYTEKLVLLDSYATAHRNGESGVPPEEKAKSVREHFGLPASGALYFCPHRLPKYHPKVDEYFRAILEKDSTGHLLILAGSNRKLAEQMTERMKKTFSPDSFRRLIVRPSLPYEKYRRLLPAVSCVLDSPIYVGDLTTHDAFERGVPVVTQMGELLVQRYTGGLYRAMDMDFMVTADVASYAAVAVRLGTEPDFREEVRRLILERNGAWSFRRAASSRNTNVFLKQLQDHDLFA